MPSANKTKYLSLNQWVETDRPVRNDFNGDNATVDSVLGGHVNNGDIHVTADEKKYLTDPICTYTYAGTGEASKTVTLTEGFRFVAVFACDMPLAGSGGIYSAMGYTGLGSSLGLSVSASGTSFTVTQGEDEKGNSLCLNEIGVQYRVIMFK